MPSPIWKRRPELLLHGQIPKPLHGVAPREILGPGWWDRTRRIAYASTKYHCLACGIFKYNTPEEYLCGHEVYEIDYLLGRMHYVETVPLCKACHDFIHIGRLRALVDRGEMSLKAFRGIVSRGVRILKGAGLDYPPEMPSGPVAEWEDWRLVIDGKEYPPKYKTFREWKRAYGYAEDS